MASCAADDTSVQRYYTRRDGGSVYKVVIRENSAEVYTLTPTGLDPSYEMEFEYSRIFTFQHSKAFVPVNKNDPTEIGNSILLKVGPLKYVFIGRGIQQFQALSEIVAYESPIDNCSPYPFAIDMLGNYYLMLENAIIQNQENLDNPYNYYYSNAMIVEINEETEDGVHIVKNGRTHYYNLTYAPDALADYIKITESESGESGESGKMYLSVHHVYHELDQDTYVDLHRRHGDTMGFKCMEAEKIHGAFM